MNIIDLQLKLRDRSQELFPECRSWTISDWLMALIGELGEAANILKKINRGDLTIDEAKEQGLGLEFGDVFSYLCLLADKCQINLEDESISAYNKVCARKGRIDLMI